MGLLNRLFGSAESLAREIEEGEKDIVKRWKDYLNTIPRKKAIIGKLKLGQNLSI